MATKQKQTVSSKLAEAFSAAQPKNPALNSSDKSFLKGLQRRGFTEQEIIEVAAKAGFVVTAEMLVVKKRAAK